MPPAPWDSLATNTPPLTILRTRICSQIAPGAPPAMRPALSDRQGPHVHRLPHSFSIRSLKYRAIFSDGASNPNIDGLIFVKVGEGLGVLCIRMTAGICWLGKKWCDKIRLRLTASQREPRAPIADYQALGAGRPPSELGSQLLAFRGPPAQRRIHRSGPRVTQLQTRGNTMPSKGSMIHTSNRSYF